MRRIPSSGINLFQLIYILIREYESASGLKALNLSLGNPDLIPPAGVRELKARFAGQAEYDLHTYAEDKNLNRFAEGLVRAFVDLDLTEEAGLRALPIAGIKTATALMPIACGLHLGSRQDFRMVTHLPAYDVAGTWGASYLGGQRVVWPLRAADGMRLNVSELKSALQSAGCDRPQLVFVIRPGNPASVGASRQEWIELIELCIERGARLVNDGAYTTISDGSHVPLAQVAREFPSLEWAELYSVSKSFSDPGARLGVMLGSRDFVDDFVLVKGNTDSGPVPSVMAAYGELFKDLTLARQMIADLYRVYRARLDYLVPKLEGVGLRPACRTTAGFFTLWQVPDRAYGIDLAQKAAESGVSRAEVFNRLVIERSGIVGVHFQGPAGVDGQPGEAYIRYAVCTDVLEPQFQSRFEAAIQEIGPVYQEKSI